LGIADFHHKFLRRKADVPEEERLMNTTRQCVSGFLGCVPMLLVLLSPLSSYGHQDTLFKIAADGEIQGLGDYGPGYLKVTPSLDSHAPTVVLTLGAMVVQIPPCVAQFFVVPKGKKITFTGDPFQIPPYFILHLPQQTCPTSSFTAGYDLLFNFYTVELISITKTDCESEYRQKVAPSSICNEDELQALGIQP
jgi:hypothetical protein